MITMTPNVPRSETLSQRLADFAQHVPQEGVTVQELVAQLGREGLLLLCFIVSLPFLLPVSIPGVSTIFGALILLIGVSETAKAPLWLPAKLKGYVITRGLISDVLEKGVRWVQRLEKLAHPRLLALTNGLMERFNGLMLIASAALLMLPFAFIPFSNTIPGLACIFLALGLLMRDGVCILLGWLFCALAAVYFAVIFWFGIGAINQWLGPYMPSGFTSLFQ
jgi:hypothetical protein